MTFFQESSSLYNNDLAIVPDLNLKRKRDATDWEDLFGSDVLQEFSFVGPKRYCVGLGELFPLENGFLSCKPAYVQPTPGTLDPQITSRNLVFGGGQLFEDSCVRVPKSMQKGTLPSPPYIDDHVQSGDCVHRLVITEEPEQYYRARYDSEGVRAPLKGINDSYPAVQIIGQQSKHAVITVKLVHEDRSEHTCCSLDSSDDRKKALTKKVGLFNNMKAEFEDLRIRREKKKEGRKNCGALDKSSVRDAKHDKVACLLFTAIVETECGMIECSAMSSPISLTAAPEPAELDWLEPSRGHLGGKEVVVIKGSKMTSPKVSFQVLCPNGNVLELPGTVDKEKSHQNVLLVRTPVVNQLPFGLGHQSILAKVVVITGRSQMFSNSLDFEFIPNDLCRECMQETTPKSLEVSPNLCQSNATFTFGPSMCPSMTSEAPRVQSSPFSPDVRPSGVSDRIHSAPLQFDALPVMSVKSSTESSTMSTTSGALVDLTLPASGVNLQAYTACNSPLLAQRTTVDVCDEMIDRPHESCASLRNGTEDWMEIMQQLMSPDSTSSAENSLISPQKIHTTPKEGSPKMYLPDSVGHPDTQIDEHSSSATQEIFKSIEEMLWGLNRENMLSQSDLMLYLDRCRCYNNMDIMKAYNVALGDKAVFLQELASIKLSSFHSTQQ